MPLNLYLNCASAYLNVKHEQLITQRRLYCVIFITHVLHIPIFQISEHTHHLLQNVLGAESLQTLSCSKWQCSKTTLFKQSKLYKSPKQLVIYPTQSTVSFHHIFNMMPSNPRRLHLKSVSFM